jgi:hypothetical protein
MTKKQKIIKMPKSLMRPIGQAVTEFEMIKEGDRILLGLSGGKGISIEYNYVNL